MTKKSAVAVFLMVVYIFCSQSWALTVEPVFKVYDKNGVPVGTRTAFLRMQEHEYFAKIGLRIGKSATIGYDSRFGFGAVVEF